MTEHADKKKRLSIYLDPELMLLLADYADRRGKSRSLVAEAAIASFLTPDADERQEAALARRLDQMDRRLTRLERDLSIAVETLAVFVHFWLTTSPPLPEPAQQAARAGAAKRYEAFVTALGPRLRQEVADEVSDTFGKANQ